MDQIAEAITNGCGFVALAIFFHAFIHPFISAFFDWKEPMR